MADFLKGKNIKKWDGSKLVDLPSADHFKGKLTVLYFSAHWCPPCRQFTPVLKDFYNDLVDDGKPIEIVFVSFDRSSEDLINYMKEAHGNWCAFPHGDECIQELAEKYGVSGIPAVVVIDASGKSVNSNGRADVQGKPPAQTFEAWKKASAHFKKADVPADRDLFISQGSF